MLIPPIRFFFPRRARSDTPASVIRVVRPAHFVHHSAILIHVVDALAVDVPHPGVVTEDAALPAAARKPGTEISRAVIHSAVKANRLPPIACMPEVAAAAEAPITRRPQHARSRWHHPVARHPKIPIIAVLIIAGRPHIPVAGTRRLVEHGNRRRRHRHGEKYPRGSLRANQRNHGQDQKKTGYLLHRDRLQFRKPANCLEFNKPIHDSSSGGLRPG